MAYLDWSSSSLTPEPVLAAMDAYYREYRANVHRGLYKASERATTEFARARKDVAMFIGATAEEIVFTSGTTDSLNKLVRMLEGELGEGDEVLLTEMEHHANLIPWQEAAKRRGFVLRFVPVMVDGRLDMQAFRTLVTAKTKIVAVTWISNVLGTVNPIAEMTKIVRKQSTAMVVVDGAQAMLHVPVYVRKLDIDFLVFSGHKMCGPTGIGVLYGKREHLRRLPPTVFGGDMMHEVTLEGATWAESPRKFEAGTPNIAGAIGLGAAVRYLKEQPMEKIIAHDAELTQYALTALGSLPGVSLVGSRELRDRVGVLSFVVAGIHPHDLAAILDTQDVAIRAGFHCAMPLMEKLSCQIGTARASFGPSTTKEDIDALIRGIQHAQRIFLKDTYGK